MIIAAVDPGKITGLAVWWDPEVYDATSHGCLDTAEVEARHTAPVLRRMLRRDERDNYPLPVAVAVERYVQTGRKTHQPQAHQVTGAVQALCDELGIKCIHQAPGPAKRIGSTATLKRLGWWTPTPDDHANSALRHVLLSLATIAPERYARLIGL